MASLGLMKLGSRGCFRVFTNNSQLAALINFPVLPHGNQQQKAFIHLQNTSNAPGAVDISSNSSVRKWTDKEVTCNALVPVRNASSSTAGIHGQLLLFGHYALLK